MPSHKQDTPISPSKAQVTLLAEESVAAVRAGLLASWHLGLSAQDLKIYRDQACQSSVTEGKGAQEDPPTCEDPRVANGC